MALADDDPLELEDMYNKAVDLLMTGEDADVERAAKLFIRAADGGHMPSRKAIGFMYLEGKGVERDLKKAFELISEAAGFLDPIASYILGSMYEGGLGVEQNDAEALALFDFAAEMGIPGAKEDAERLTSRIAERRVRKLASRPILELEISDADIEAVCCKRMLDSVADGTIRHASTINGHVLIKNDESGVAAYGSCPFCGKETRFVSKNKMY